MGKSLINSSTRCKLKDLQTEYSKKYTAEEFLHHEESYILDSFQLLFEDVKGFFGKSLLMLDGYYLSDDKSIKSINIRLANRCAEYKKLSAKFHKEYSTILQKVKEEAKQDPNQIISISHELIKHNRRTGVCILKRGKNSTKPSLPLDCHFVDLVKLGFIDKDKGNIPEYLFTKKYKSVSFEEEYTSLIKSLSVDKSKHQGLARTMELYHHLLKDSQNCYVYFIRPRTIHNDNVYNGTLVLFVDKVLPENEFNLLASFLNDILCETAIARLVYKAELKLKSELSCKTGLVFWGDEDVSNELNTAVKTNLSVSLRDLVNDKTLNEEVNQMAIKAKDEFINYIKSSFTTASSRLSERAKVTNFFHKEIIKLPYTEDSFKEKFKQSVVVRRALLLLTYLRNKNEILDSPASLEQKKYLQYLPYFVLATFETKVFDNTITEKDKKKREDNTSDEKSEVKAEKEKYYGGKSFASIRQYLRYVGLVYSHKQSHSTPDVEIKFHFDNGLPRIHQSEMDWLNTFISAK